MAPGELLATHGTDLTVEHGSVAVWARTWGRAVHAFTPGLLLSAIQREVTAIQPGVQVKRAGTRQTAMSQHCLCGHRHKKSLSERTHRCAACGLEGGRDAVAAVLASCVEFTDPADPTTATVDYTLTAKLLADPATWQTLHHTVNRKTLGVQERPAASTDTPDPTP
ncbi:MAG TPA: zinc ribbon domain-containing protein, partial [Euzebya sp.]|nr:zinc ribbon domain-containing protein [Euzebya sp.]